MAETGSAENITCKRDVEPTPARRSLLFVPGSDARKLERAREAAADGVILDLEDSVAMEKKADARRLVAEALAARAFGGVEAVVRINPPGSAHFEADLESMIGAGCRTIMLSKSESAPQIADFARKIRPAKLLLLIETPLGIVNAPAIATASDGVDALCFGPADFSLAMGLAETDASRGIAYHARCGVVLAAKAAGIAAIDSVFLWLKDDDAFRKDAELGLALGYDGKLCIHPRQVEIVNAVYTPSGEAVERALRIMAAWEQANAEGRGVFALDGVMVDAPLVAAQRRVLARAGRRASRR
jgi:citrate lyase subunit beta/citryl-CoA lyase